MDDDDDDDDDNDDDDDWVVESENALEMVNDVVEIGEFSIIVVDEVSEMLLSVDDDDFVETDLKILKIRC